MARQCDRFESDYEYELSAGKWSKGPQHGLIVRMLAQHGHKMHSKQDGAAVPPPRRRLNGMQTREQGEYYNHEQTRMFTNSGRKSTEDVTKRPQDFPAPPSAMIDDKTKRATANVPMIGKAHAQKFQ
jgi:hypothetical protein